MRKALAGTSLFKHIYETWGTTPDGNIWLFSTLMLHQLVANIFFLAGQPVGFSSFAQTAARAESEI